MLYKNKCSCGKYETTCDMPQSIAHRAAEMHIMLKGDHEVLIFNRDNRKVAIFSNKDIDAITAGDGDVIAIFRRTS